MKKAISELKKGKAAGKDGIPAELLKAGSERLYYAIHQIILRIWADEQMPKDWLEGLSIRRVIDLLLQLSGHYVAQLRI